MSDGKLPPPTCIRCGHDRAVHTGPHMAADATLRNFTDCTATNCNCPKFLPHSLINLATRRLRPMIKLCTCPHCGVTMTVEAELGEKVCEHCADGEYDGAAENSTADEFTGWRDDMRTSAKP